MSKTDVKETTGIITAQVRGEAVRPKRWGISSSDSNYSVDLIRFTVLVIPYEPMPNKRGKLEIRPRSRGSERSGHVLNPE